MKTICKPARVPKMRFELRTDIPRYEAAALPALRGLDPNTATQEQLDEMGAFAGIRAASVAAASGDMYLATEPMTKLAVDAATDLPREACHAGCYPADSGVMVFEGGLPEVTTNDGLITARPEMVTWAAIDGYLFVIGWAPMPAGRISSGDVKWAPIMNSGTSLLPGDLEPWEEMHPDAANLISVMVAAWKLMEMPTVTAVDSRNELGPKIRAGKREAPREVKVVSLRRLARKDMPEREESGKKRVYTHQWIVRGHWRNQAVGAGRASHRITWVPSYLKGPEDAPMLPSETVFVWRR